MFLKNVLLSALLAKGLLLASPLQAQESALSYDQYLSELKQQAVEQGIAQGTIDAVFDQIKLFKKAVVNEPAKSGPENLDKYLPNRVSEALVEQARSLYRDNKALFDRLGKEYGVQPRFVLAYWGITSAFDASDYPALTVIASNAYHGEQAVNVAQAYGGDGYDAAFISALKLMERDQLKFDNLKSDSTGLMGYPHFTPKQLAKYGQDGNGDGRVDIWHSLDDAFATTANYLKQLGWDYDGTWGRQVSAPKALPQDLVGLAVHKGFDQWQALGVRRFNGSDLPSRKDMQVSLIMPDGKNGRSYLVYDNYRVLRKTQGSEHLTLAVTYLSERIKYPEIK
ncbi:lytic transglycosylase domain-containing protein [Shewanella aquimarina]|uniref:lytic murein transglycosylase n=1 Tax=Shewanella aquimarina TaxID=260365 RepID=UPI002014FDAC|nr:lytic murein transglycosylase [Shewanella aquimarina]MCL2911084.1 lytic murein transglycosylase [Shewanella aquimarina]